MNRIETVLHYTEGPTVLDLGAAQHDASNASNDDWLHKHVAREFSDVIGVDYLESAVDALNDRGYDFRHADVTDMDLDVVADTVIAGELIEHLANPGLMIERTRAHLRDGGRFILTTPNPWAIVHLRRWASDAVQINNEHCAWYGPVVLKQLLNRYDFDVEQTLGAGPPQRGLTGLAQAVGSDVFGHTTWVIIAQKA